MEDICSLEMEMGINSFSLRDVNCLIESTNLNMKTICCDGWSMVTSAMGERAALYGHQVKHRVMMEDMLVNVDDCTLAGTVGGAVKKSDIQIQIGRWQGKR